MEEQTDFPIVMRGYDRVQVDLQIQTLNNQISELQQRLDTVDQRNVDLGEQLAEAQKQLRSSDRSSYTGDWCSDRTAPAQRGRTVYCRH